MDELSSAFGYRKFVEKGKAARPGETRNWGGQDYTKQPDGSWKPKAAGKKDVPRNVGAAWGQKIPLNPKAAGAGQKPPRGKPANLKGWDAKMPDTLDFNWGKGDANEHDVHVHYIAHPGERGGRYEDAQPPYAEVMVVNQHGEDVTHHVPEKHIKDIEARALRHAAGREEAGREPIDSRI